MSGTTTYVASPPLPAEILALSEGDTACQYCGVSYLLLSRMTALKKNFSDLEHQLNICKKYEEEYPQLKKHSSKLQEGNEVLQELVKKHSNQIHDQADKISEINSRNQFLETALYNRGRSIVRFQSLCDVNQKYLTESFVLVRQMKNQVISLRNDTYSSIRSLRVYVKTLTLDLVAKVRQDSDNTVISRVASIKEELARQHMDQQSILSAEMDDLHRKVKFLHEIVDNERHLKDELQVECRNLQHDLEKTKLSRPICTEQELQELKDQVCMQTSILNENTAQIEQLRQGLQGSKEENAALTCSLRSERNDHSITKTEFEKFKAHVDQLTTTEERVNELRKENEDLHSQIRLASKERAEIGLAHQTQLDQLHNSFQEKLNLTEQGMNSAYKQEHEQLKALMDKQFLDTKEIEHQLQSKIWELTKSIESFTQDLRHKEAQETRLETQLRSAREQVRDLEHNHHMRTAEIKNLYERQLQTQKQDYEQEMAKLKSQIHELVNDQGINQTHQINNAVDEQEWWKKERKGLAEEIAMLKSTVRRECEERLELKHQLSTLASCSTPLNPLPDSAKHSPTPPLESSPSLNSEHMSIETMFEKSLSRASAIKAKKIRMMGRP